MRSVSSRANAQHRGADLASGGEGERKDNEWANNHVECLFLSPPSLAQLPNPSRSHFICPKCVPTLHTRQYREYRYRRRDVMTFSSSPRGLAITHTRGEGRRRVIEERRVKSVGEEAEGCTLIHDFLSPEPPKRRAILHDRSSDYV